MLRILYRRPHQLIALRSYTAAPSPAEIKQWEIPSQIELDGKTFQTDENYNLTPKIHSLLERRLLSESANPLSLLKRRIVDHFHKSHRKLSSRSPLFAVCENESRIVSCFDNFDSLLTPADHISRRPSDTYYINSDQLLRGHTSAHQHSLIRQGSNAFLVIGDVYRRDEIDRTHYPCFHQIEGVRLFSQDELFGRQPTTIAPLFETDGERLPEKQERHSRDAAMALQISLKSSLEDLCRSIFGPEAEMRWIDAYFPFTHPSFELEVMYEGKWLELLGCGVMEQQLLDSAGASDKVGWAFGMGLERLAMVMYGIPDIRLFWSKDSGFLSQFEGLTPDNVVKYKPVSVHPQLTMDISFWLPLGVEMHLMKANVMDVIRSIGGDLVEQVLLVDEFEHKKKCRFSQCYRIVYRSHERPLTKNEVNVLQSEIHKELVNRYHVEIR